KGPQRPRTTEIRRSRTEIFAISVCSAPPWLVNLKTPELLGRARPDDALVHLRDRSQSFVEESLETFSFIRLGGVEVPLRIDGDAVHAVELSRLPSAVAERRQFFERLAIDDLHLLVHTVGHEDVLLLGVFRERDVPHRPGVQRVLLVPL